MLIWFGLGGLVCIYDDNAITIDGSTSLSYSDDAVKRFEAYGWHVLEVADGDNDLAGIEAARQTENLLSNSLQYSADR